MSFNFGEFNPALTKAINRVSKDTACIKFLRHARTAMDDDGFDDAGVLAGLRRGKVFGPEIQSGELRGNVLHSGFHIRVSVGDIEYASEDWSKLVSFTVVSVMRIE